MKKYYLETLRLKDVTQLADLKGLCCWWALEAVVGINRGTLCIWPKGSLLALLGGTVYVLADPLEHARTPRIVKHYQSLDQAPKTLLQQLEPLKNMMADIKSKVVYLEPNGYFYFRN